jgi:hypothetical protein
VSVLSVQTEVLLATFEALRRCGGGTEECIVYWLGPVSDPRRVDEILQPPHRADYGWYDVDAKWVTQFFLDLRATRRSVRAQVHTHPGASVKHSTTDDGFAIAPRPGFISIVVPYFATRAPSLSGAFATEMTSSGNWVERDPEAVFEWS